MLQNDIGKQKHNLNTQTHTRTPSLQKGHLKIRSTKAFIPPASAMAPYKQHGLQLHQARNFKVNK